jgi:hypothetical protein
MYEVQKLFKVKSAERMITHNKPQKTSKEITVTCLKVLSWYLPKGGLGPPQKTQP